LFVPDAQGQFAVLQAGNSPSGVVGLRVTTSDGLRAMATFPIAVRNIPPTVDAGPDRRAAIGVPIQFSFTVDDAVAEKGKDTIDWGDNTAPSVGTPQFTRHPQTLTGSHTYTKKGTYTVTFNYQ